MPYSCQCCGCFYNADAALYLDEHYSNGCLECGGFVRHTFCKPDPDDPYEKPFTKEKTVRLVGVRLFGSTD